MAGWPTEFRLAKAGQTSRAALVLWCTVVCLTLAPDIIYARHGPLAIQIDWSVGESPKGGWTVGDQIPIRLTVTYPVGLAVTLPELPKAWGSFEVQRQTLKATVGNTDGTFTAVREATVTLWVPGSHQAPQYSVRYRDSDGRLHEVLAPELTLVVESVLQIGMTDKRDLKPQASLPIPSIWPLILASAFLAALGVVAGRLIFVHLYRGTPICSEPPGGAPFCPPHEVAYRELGRIAALNLSAQGQCEQQYTLITNCLRTYIQERYGIPATDLTTEELTAVLGEAQLDRDHIDLFGELLSEADLVKFAKFSPSLEQTNAIVGQARHIIDVTRARRSEDERFGGADSLSPEQDIARSVHQSRST